MTSAEQTVASIDELHERAGRATGLTDFGERDYLEGFGVLRQSYATEAGLTELGVKHTNSMLRTVLESRLRTVESWKQHPEHVDVPLRRPVFVTGLPRTGTTALHRLLCCDTAHQGLEHWLTEAPQPRPPRQSWDSNPDYQRMRDWVEARYAANPEFRGVHFMAPGAVEECWRVKRQTMRSVAFENTAHIPTYSDWLSHQDRTPVYEFHRRVLQLVGLHDTRRWVLKLPGHLFSLDALMQVYPDALVVQTHRDPRTIIASVSSLNQQASAGSSTTYHGELVGNDCLELWARGVETFTEARKRYDPAQFVDVYYDDFVSDAVGTVESIYERFGIPLSAETRTVIGTSHAESKTGAGRPRHHYQLSDFGLTEGEVTERFSAYISEHFPSISP